MHPEVVGEAGEAHVFELDDPATAGPHSAKAFGLKSANRSGMQRIHWGGPTDWRRQSCAPPRKIIGWRSRGQPVKQTLL